MILDELKKSIDEEQNALLLKSSEYKQKQDNFRKADKTAFKIYQNLENVEDEIQNIENSTLKLKEDKKTIHQEKLEIEKQTLNFKIQFEQNNIKLKSLKQELNIKKQNLERIISEINPLFSSQDMELRPIQEIEKDMEKIERELLHYTDIDDRILIEKEEIVNNLAQIKKNQKVLERDIDAAITTEKKMEQTYYDRFSEVLIALQEKINHKFKLAKIKAYCSLELIGGFEQLGIKIKAATSKDQLKSCTALSGGQISMISICLILSLQEIKPSPLCMFDEAGMFLDDKNSEASYQMIKSTLENNPIQLLMFLPKSSNSLFLLADKLIGVARVGKREMSTIFHPKIIRGE
jgi:chromosome segregation ATPase